jgi:tight adherence protein C
MPTLICLGAACAIALLCACGLAALRAAPPPPPSVPQEPRSAALPGWLRVLKWALRVPAGFIAPLIRNEIGRVVGRQLARAELDAFFEPDEWLALGLVLLLPGVVLAVPLGDLLPGPALLKFAVIPAAVGLAPWLWLHDRGKRLKFEVLRDLPGALDTLNLALEAGCAFGPALQIVVERAANGPLRRALQRCQQEMRAGRVRREALERLAQRLAIPALSATVAAIVQAEQTGVSLAPVIRAQAVRATQQRFSRAERLAMEAPIRMLAPLVICIFPCTFLVVGFPIAATLFWGA